MIKLSVYYKYNKNNIKNSKKQKYHSNTDIIKINGVTCLNIFNSSFQCKQIISTLLSCLCPFIFQTVAYYNRWNQIQKYEYPINLTTIVDQRILTRTNLSYRLSLILGQQRKVGAKGQ
ncbi:hypothetical protein pb186bvf_009792 [Paramecium bursaria]